MEMHEIRYFLAVCETLNFTRAAENCHVSQPALTRAIKKLENQLGNNLFYREGKRILLSEFGQIMRPSMEAIHDKTLSVQSLADEFNLLNKAPLSIGVMTTIGPLGLSRFLASFQRDNPGIEVQIEEGAPDAILRRLEAGEIELGILSSPQGFDGRFRSDLIYRERYVVVFSPNHHLKEKSSIRLRDLSGENYVDRLACEMRELVVQACGENNVELYATYRSGREDWIQAMVLAEMGFAFLPEYSVTLSGMISRTLIDPEVVREVAIVSVPGRPRTPAGDAFMRAIRSFNWPR